jgi:hypothetical protein
VNPATESPDSAWDEDRFAQYSAPMLQNGLISAEQDPPKIKNRVEREAQFVDRQEKICINKGHLQLTPPQNCN